MGESYSFASLPFHIPALKQYCFSKFCQVLNGAINSGPGYFAGENLMISTGRLALILSLTVVASAFLPHVGSSQTMSRHTAASILAVSPAPELDLSIRHYSRLSTPGGLVRENRYEEIMLRRNNHVWLARVLPESLASGPAQQHARQPRRTVALHGAPSLIGQGLPPQISDPGLMPRHITLEQGKLKLELIDTQNREILAVTPADYGAINFDGSWSNTYYLLDPAMVTTLFLADQPVPGTRWRTREKNGYFQRVLWDEQNMIPLAIETGNSDGSFFRRTEVRIRKNVTSELPWKNLETYTRKDYPHAFD